MDDSDLLNFDPVPVRARRDGWTPKRQYFFILALARGFTATKAAAMLGMTRKTAYELCRKPGGEGFARAWAAAVARARERKRAARSTSLSGGALHGEWHPRLYQGRLIGWEHRPANERAVGLLKHLERKIERLPAGTDSVDYERYLKSLTPEGDETREDSPIGRQLRHVSAGRRA